MTNETAESPEKRFAPGRGTRLLLIALPTVLVAALLALMLFAVLVLPTVLPPIVKVIVVVGLLDVCVQLNSVVGFQIVNTEMVVRAAASLLST